MVFATETLAAGINMPARCTVISSMARRRNAGVAMLTHNELLQMAGALIVVRWTQPDHH